ncbi:MAG TPA: hypothetical protein DF383_12905 [Deltaproteobacteria bacterium]|nr:hypothetical protein [Deltaproteobacteria bacterium]
MKSSQKEFLVKKSVTLDETKLRKVKKLLKIENDSQVLRILIDQALANRSMVKSKNPSQSLRGLAHKLYPPKYLKSERKAWAK